MKKTEPIPSTQHSKRSSGRKEDDGRSPAPKSRRYTKRLIEKLVERHRDTLDYLAK